MSPERQQSDWQFWVAVPIVGIVLCVGLVGFHRYTQIGRSLSVDGLALVGTTLVAAAAGFLAILYQVRSASRQLREQLADQHRTLATESERQKKAVATALLFEIDGFYATYLRQPRDLLTTKEVAKDPLPRFTSIGPNRFPVFHGNASKIGELPTDCVLALVGFFRQADSIVSNLADYTSSLDRARDFEHAPRDVPDPWVSRGGHQALARVQLGRIKNVLPEAIRAAHLVCHMLCKFAGIPFEHPTVTLAAERLPDDQTRTSLIPGDSETPLQSANAEKN